MYSTPEYGWLAAETGRTATQAPASPAETRLRELHDSEAAVVVSGEGAAAAYTLTALTNPGGHVIVSAALHGAARAYLDHEFHESGRAVSLADCADVAAVAELIRPETQLIMTESITDPGMCPIPVNDLAALAHSTDLLLVVDNTALSPAHLRPLDLGATVVIEEVSPYLDDQAGLGLSVVCGPRRLLRRVSEQAARTGGRPDPWPDRMLCHTLRTLRLRMAAHHRHADEVAEFLRAHPGVVAVNRPGYQAAPWARETHAGFGGLVSFTSRVPITPDRVGGPISVPAWDGRADVTPYLVRVEAGHEDAGELITRLDALLTPVAAG